MKLEFRTELREASVFVGAEHGRSWWKHLDLVTVCIGEGNTTYCGRSLVIWGLGVLARSSV